MYMIMDTPKITITQNILSLIAGIDEFKGKWLALGKLSPLRLDSMRKVASVQSVGSSTRIEGAKLSDEEVEKLLSGAQFSGFQSRDEEEVAGYAECLRMVVESHDEIPLNENHIKQLHKELLKYSSKDARHRGKYKKLPNNVEAFDRFGESLGIVFETSSPFDTPRKMAELNGWFEIEWRRRDIHPLLAIAIYIVVFLAIHPFQDGNGRLSRILTTLLLLKAGYKFVPFSSLERVVEENKDQYYLSLQKAQRTMSSGNISLDEWIIFFLQSIWKQILALNEILKEEELASKLAPLSEELMQIAGRRGKLTVRVAVKITSANRNTVKAHLKRLVEGAKLKQEGCGKGTWYRPA